MLPISNVNGFDLNPDDDHDALPHISDVCENNSLPTSSSVAVAAAAMLLVFLLFACSCFFNPIRSLCVFDKLAAPSCSKFGGNWLSKHDFVFCGDNDNDDPNVNDDPTSASFVVFLLLLLMLLIFSVLHLLFVLLLSSDDDDNDDNDSKLFCSDRRSLVDMHFLL